MKATRVSLYVVGWTLFLFCLGVLALNAVSLLKKTLIENKIESVYKVGLKIQRVDGGWFSGVTLHGVDISWPEESLIESLSSKNIQSDIQLNKSLLKGLPKENVVHLDTTTIKLKRFIRISLENTFHILSQIPEGEIGQEGLLHLERDRLILDNVKQPVFFVQQTQVNISHSDQGLEKLVIVGQTPRQDQLNRFYLEQNWGPLKFNAKIVFKDFSLLELKELSPHLNILGGKLDSLVQSQNGNLKEFNIHLKNFQFRWRGGRQNQIEADIIYQEERLEIQQIRWLSGKNIFRISGNIQNFATKPDFDLKIELSLGEDHINIWVSGPYDHPQIYGIYTDSENREKIRWDFKAENLFFTQSTLYIRGIDGEYWYQPFKNSLRLKGNLAFSPDRLRLSHILIGNWIRLDGLIQFFPESFLDLKITLSEKEWMLPFGLSRAGTIQGHGQINGSFEEPHARLSLKVVFGIFNTLIEFIYDKGKLKWLLDLTPIQTGFFDLTGKLRGHLDIETWAKSGLLWINIFTDQVKVNQVDIPSLDVMAVVETRTGKWVLHHIQLGSEFLMRAESNWPYLFSDIQLHIPKMDLLQKILFPGLVSLEGALEIEGKLLLENEERSLYFNFNAFDGKIEEFGFDALALKIDPCQGMLVLDNFGFEEKQNSLKLRVDFMNLQYGLWSSDIILKELSFGPYSLTGTFQGKGSYKFSNKEKQILLEAQTDHLVLNRIPIGRAQVQLYYDLTHQILDLYEVKLGEVLKLKGKFDFEHQQIDLRIDVTQADADMLRLLAPQAKVDALKGLIQGYLQISSDLSYPKWIGRLDIQNGQLFKHTFDHAFFNITGFGPSIDLKNSRIMRGTQQLDVKGAVNLSDPLPFKDVKFVPIHGSSDVLPTDPSGYLRRTTVKKPLGEKWQMSVTNFNDDVKTGSSGEANEELELEYSRDDDTNFILRMDEHEGMFGIKKKMEF